MVSGQGFFFVFWPFWGAVHIIHGLLMYCNQFISVTYKNQERMLQERSLRRIQYVPENDFPLKARNEIAIITVSQPFMISMPVGVGNLVLGNPYRSALAAQQLSIDEGIHLNIVKYRTTLDRAPSTMVNRWEETIWKILKFWSKLALICLTKHK